METTTPSAPPSKFSLRLPVSVRTRLIVANLLVVLLSVSGLGYYVFDRSRQASAYLTTVLENNVRQKAQDNLTSIRNLQAKTLDSVFSGAQADITNIGSSADLMLANAPGTALNPTWDAAQQLVRLPNGSWDNLSSSEPASVFIPARVELDDALTTEINTLRQLDFVVPAVLKSNPDVVAVYFGGPSGETIYYPNIDLANVVPPDFDVTTRPWYVAANVRNNPLRTAVWSAPYLDAATHGLIITTSIPIFDSSNEFRGVVAMDVQLSRVSTLVSGIRVGRTGYAFVIDQDGRVISLPPAGYKDLGYTPDLLPLGDKLDSGSLPKPLPADLAKLIPSMRIGQSGLDTITVNGVERYITYRPLSQVPYELAIIVPTSEMLTDIGAAQQQAQMAATDTQQISFVLILLLVSFAFLAMFVISNTLVGPLVDLTETANEITQGDLNATARVRGRDEIATLAQTLNTMTTRLRELIQSLERRVADRTAALEVASKHATLRAAQFEAITQVTRAISSIRNMDELMPLVAAVISQHFGFYHVGIFLNDEDQEYAWLIAANSEGGHRMLQRHHNLKIGAQGMVGYVAAHGESRVARTVGQDAVFFNNPDLPDTKSEAVIPLRRGPEIAGVLDVQSTKEDAFTDEDLSILAILADQVSLAMENTRLFETTRRSLMEAETLYRQYVQKAWSRLPQEGQITGYRYTPRGASPLSAASDTNAIPATNEPGTAPAIVVPIKLRGETIGNLMVRSQRSGGWTQDQRELAEAVAERVALSAENARLFDETSRRAERERLVTEITSRIRSTNDPDEMIRTAVEELRNALGASEIQIIPQVITSIDSDDDEPMAANAPQGILRGNGAKQ